MVSVDRNSNAAANVPSQSIRQYSLKEVPMRLGV